MHFCILRKIGTLNLSRILTVWMLLSATVESRADIFAVRSHRADVNVSVIASDQRLAFQGVNPVQENVTGTNTGLFGASVSRGLSASHGRAFAASQAFAYANEYPLFQPAPLQAGGTLFVRTEGIGNEGEIGNSFGYYFGASSGGAIAGSAFGIQRGMGASTHFTMAWGFSPGAGGLLYGPGSHLTGGQTTARSGKVSGLLNQDEFEIRLHTSSNGVGHFAQGSVTWAVNGQLPGLSADNPLSGTSSLQRLNGQTKYFQAPAASGYGTDTPLYFSTADFDPGAGVIRTGDAVFESDLLAFAGIVAPTAIPDSGSYTLQFAGSEVTLQPGSTFNFLDVSPDGVTSFRLLGLGDLISNDPDRLSSYSTGLMFAGDGVASFQYQTLIVPEPNTAWLLVLLTNLFVLRRSR